MHKKGLKSLFFYKNCLREEFSGSTYFQNCYTTFLPFKDVVVVVVDKTV